MSNHLDDRIRDLYAELADAAPPLPPLTAPEKVSRPWVTRWPVLVAAATATIVVIAAVPLLLGGGLFGTGDEASDTTSIAAAETTEAPTTTAAEAAPETTEAAAETTEAPTTTVSTGSPFLDAVQSTTVSTEPVTLPADVLAAADGLVVGALVEFVWPDDGSTGHEFVVMVVDSGAATMILGRDCRVESGSPPFADTGGGVVVHGPSPDISDVRRCTPGEEVEPLAEDGQAMTTALVDGRPVVAIGTESSIRVLDLDSGATDVLATFDPSVETPTAASYGDGMWMISLLAAGEPFNAGGSTRYVFLDAAGAPLDVASNPAPDFSAATATYRMAALTPHGSELVFAEQFADLSADVVVWDLAAGVEIERYRVIEPFTTSADDAGGGQRFVGSLDASDTEILVNVNIAFGAVAPEGIIRIDRTSGSVVDVVSSTEGIDFQVASFLDRP